MEEKILAFIADLEEEGGEMVRIDGPEPSVSPEDRAYFNQIATAISTLRKLVEIRRGRRLKQAAAEAMELAKMQSCPNGCGWSRATCGCPDCICDKC